MRFLLLSVLLMTSSSFAAPSWKQVDQLASERKLQAALDATLQRLQVAKERRDPEEWTLALVKATQLQIGLHGYETAVRFLDEQPWPDQSLAKVTLGLARAAAIQQYADAYAYEIRRRERVDTKGTVDLRQLTWDQLMVEVQKGFAKAWEAREELGKRPLSTLSGLLSIGNYPADVRGTLRDAVTYLRAQTFANSGTWRAEHENEVWRLDAGALISGDAAVSAKIDLENPEVHPLLKLGAVLDDLEAWHRRNNHQAAALEARRQRAEYLYSLLGDGPKRQLVREDLAKRLPAFRRVSWWSMGQWQLAHFAQLEQRLTQALALAREGAAAYPRSPGGHKCTQIAAALTAPNYALTSMSADGLGERSLTVTHRNLKTLHLRAWRVDVEDRLSSSREGVFLNYVEMREWMRGRTPDAEWKVALPATPDLREHRTYVTPPLEKKGLYLIAASATPGFTSVGNRVSAVQLQLSELVLRSEKLPNGSVRVVVHEAESGKPVPDAKVALFRTDWRKSPQQVRAAQTDAEGEVTLAVPGSDYAQHFVYVKKGDDALVDQRHLTASRDGREPETHSRALIYTDRTVYRPLQKVMWKVVAFSGGGEKLQFKTEPKARLAVQLHDANGEQVAEQTVTTNAFGSAAGEFTLPPGRLLGGWTIHVTGRESAQIRVEEYKRPTFEVSLKEPESALRLNTKATLRGEARYYFGLPVTAGQVKWRVRRVPDYPWWWGFWGRPVSGEQVVGTGSAPLGEDGTFSFTFVPEANAAEAKEGVTYAYRVEVDATDEGGETRGDARTFRLGFVAVQGRIDLPGSFVQAGSKETLELFRSDLDGAPRAGSATWKLVGLKTPERIDLETIRREEAAPRALPEGEPGVVTAGDKLSPRSSALPSTQALLARFKDGSQIANGTVTHDAKGKATLELPALAPGAYRLRYETKDAAGGVFKTFRDVLVGGKGEGRLPLPLALQVDRSLVRVGEAAEVLIATGLSEATLVLEVWRGNTRVSAQRFEGSTAKTLSLPIAEVDRGGLDLFATLISDHQVFTAHERITVPFDNAQLELSFSTFRDRLRPGQKETWRVSVKGPKGARLEAKSAELLAYMYDQALEVFAPHQPPTTDALRPQRYSRQERWNTWGQAWGQVIEDNGFATVPSAPSLTPSHFAIFPSYGIGGVGVRGGPGGMHLNFRKRAISDSLARPEGAAIEEDDSAGAPPPMAMSAAPLQSDAPAPPAEGKGAAEGGGEPTALRSDFSETAFFAPHLLVDRKGQVSFEFTVPDSVTRWNVWVHGVTRDLKGGSLQKTAESVKDLMVRPYVPRFLREGDTAAIEVAVNNASDQTLTGTIDFDIIDPDTQKSLLSEFGLSPREAKGRSFEAAAQRGTTLRYELKAPSQVKTVAFRVVAKSGDFSDGELRPLPILPSRMRLAQSRFVTLKGEAAKTLRFEDLAKPDDPTRMNEQLVVTIDAQLFASVLNALPYLIDYPYESTEQLLNQFVSTGIVSSVFDRYPAVGTLAKELSRRTTRLEAFAAADPNRKMLLEETPWLQESRGGTTDERLIKVLDPKIARAHREASLAKLQKAQTASGGFPWFPGGPPSPYLTTYILHGLARAAEHQVAIPEELTRRAFNYVASYYRSDWQKIVREDKCCWESITFLNFVASSFPDARYTGDAFTAKERQEMLDFSFRHWKEHSPYLKGMLALTLHRMKRSDDAKRVFESVMDSAKTSDELGTFWAPEERSWLWYNDTTETHAFALRVLSELAPKDPRRDGLVQWLFLDKKLNHWKSTRATAEAIYSLVKYLEQEKALGVRESVAVKVGGKTVTFGFEPDKFTGKGNQVVVEGEQIVPARDASIGVSKTSKGFAFASATWHFSTEKLPEEARGDFFNVERRYFLRDTSGREATLTPLKEGARLRVGDEIEVQLSLKTKHQAEYVHLRDPRGAGFEPVNPVSTHKWSLGIVWYEETRDSGANFFFEKLPVGEYPFRYRLRATMAGSFRVGPATVQSLYAPEFNAYSSGALLRVEN